MRIEQAVVWMRSMRKDSGSMRIEMLVWTGLKLAPAQLVHVLNAKCCVYISCYASVLAYTMQLQARLGDEHM